MLSAYVIALIVGGFFVLLSIFGGGETDFDADADVDFDFDVDADVDVDFDASTGLSGDWVDLFSIRALFLFAAFFGLTGALLTWFGGSEPLNAILAVLTGLVVGLGGNYVIKRVGYARVSSNISVNDLAGSTGKVLVPFEGDRRGKIQLVARGQQLELLARGLTEDEDRYETGDEIVVVRMDGSVAEVVKPT